MAKDKQPFEVLRETTETEVEQNMENARGAIDTISGFFKTSGAPI